MDHLETVSALAVLAKIWFNDSTSLNEFIVLVMTLKAFETCFFHFRNDIRVPDNNTFNCD